jgi:sulfur carrier protein ThiS
MTENKSATTTEVEVKLFPPLQENRFSKRLIELGEEATVGHLLTRLGINEEEVEAIYLNGKEANFKSTLHSGDRVTLLPFIGGG